jgi:ribosomal subunit interface protein
MEIIFKARQTDVAARFRDLATAKLEKLEKLDQKAIRVDVEVSVERNPRQASQKERVELTILSRGPAIRAEAAAEDRFAALDMALAKLDSRLRRALDRRKRHHVGHGSERAAERREPEQLMLPEDMELSEQAGAAYDNGSSAQGRPPSPASVVPRQQQAQRQAVSAVATPDSLDPSPPDSVVPIEMEGDGPLVVRQKFHHAGPITIDQALLEMELVGHDFYLFHDIDEDMPSVVYRRHGYQYGVIRLVEASASHGGQRAPAPAVGVQADVPARPDPARSSAFR